MQDERQKGVEIFILDELTKVLDASGSPIEQVVLKDTPIHNFLINQTRSEADSKSIKYYIYNFNVVEL